MAMTGAFGIFATLRRGAVGDLATSFAGADVLRAFDAGRADADRLPVDRVVDFDLPDDFDLLDIFGLPEEGRFDLVGDWLVDDWAGDLPVDLRDDFFRVELMRVLKVYLSWVCPSWVWLNWVVNSRPIA